MPVAKNPPAPFINENIETMVVIFGVS